MMKVLSMMFLEFNEKFPAEKAAIDYFYHVRYKGKLTCPHCGVNVNVYRTSRRKVSTCHNWDNTFSTFAFYNFQKHKNGYAEMVLFLNLKKSFPHRSPGAKNHWKYLPNRLEYAATNKNTDRLKRFDAFVEIDETYVRGKPRKENSRFDKDGNKIIDRTKRGRGNPVGSRISLSKKTDFLTNPHFLLFLSGGCSETEVSEQFYKSILKR
jgi:hypothetical protein